MLEEGSYAIDRATFEFYAQGLAVEEARLAWAEAVDALWRKAGETLSGTAVVGARGRRFVASWSREDGRGEGHVVAVEAMAWRMEKALASAAIAWRLVERNGGRLAPILFT